MRLRSDEVIGVQHLELAIQLGHRRPPRRLVVLGRHKRGVFFRGPRGQDALGCHCATNAGVTMVR